MATTGPYHGRKLWVNPDSNASRQAKEWAKTDVYGAALMRALARFGDADWLTDSSAADVESRVDRMLDTSGDSLRVLVAYRGVDRDMGSHSAGGASAEAEYLDWCRRLAKGIGQRLAIVILEPDYTAMSTKLDSAGRAVRLNMLSEAVDILGESGADVYIDAGSSNWIPVDRISELLVRAGIQRAKGAALNVSGTQFEQDEVRYGAGIRARTGGQAWFVVDCSRNGRGQFREREGDHKDADWCCSPLRGVGPRPTLNIPDAQARLGLAAKVFIKSIGGEDGNCGRCTKAGRFNPEYARELADLAIPPLVQPPPD
jgi:endoglucanase